MNNGDRSFPAGEGPKDRCKWCGASLKSSTAIFCSECKAPQTVFGHLLYAADFVGKNLAIPLAIGLVTFLLTAQQQESALIVSSRQRLAEGLGEVGKVQADNRLAYSQIDFMAVAKDDTVPAKELKDAVLKLDLAIASFGAKLGPFEEFARRTNYYGPIGPSQPTRLQMVWDRCFVQPYWGDDKTPGYLSQIKDSISKCGEAMCPKSVAQELKKIYDKFYLGLCYPGDPEIPEKSIPQVWFNRELRRIAVQASNPNPWKAGPE